MSDMNPEAQAQLEKILAKGNLEITQADLDFLRARQSYLTEEQLERFAEILPTREEKLVNREDQLKAMKRPQLDQILDNLGLNPADYANKDEAIKAIVEFDGKSDDDSDDEQDSN